METALQAVITGLHRNRPWLNCRDRPSGNVDLLIAFLIAGFRSSCRPYVLGKVRELHQIDRDGPLPVKAFAELTRKLGEPLSWREPVLVFGL